MSIAKERHVKQDIAVVSDLQDRIFTIRGEKVILDSDFSFSPPDHLTISTVPGEYIGSIRTSSIPSACAPITLSPSVTAICQAR